MANRQGEEIIHFLAAEGTPYEGALCAPGSKRHGKLRRDQYVATRELETVTCGNCRAAIERTKNLVRMRCKAK